MPLDSRADLKKLFDYQRFEQERNLQTIIDRVESKYGLGEHDAVEQTGEEVICFKVNSSKITDIRTKTIISENRKWIES